MTPTPARQRGATLLVAMIFLLLISLFAVSAFKSSTSHLRIVGNMQVRQESVAAAQQAIEQTISNSLFTISPQQVAASPVGVDLDGDGKTDYTAQLNPTPRCYRTQPIKTAQLNPDVPADQACMQSAALQQSGIEMPDMGTTSGNSLCAHSEWDVSAKVTDARTGSDVVVHQGVLVRVLEANANADCLK